MFAIGSSRLACAQEAIEVAEVGLSFELPFISELKSREDDAPFVLRRWTGKLDDKAVRLCVWLNPNYDTTYQGPEHYIDGFARTGDGWSLQLVERVDIPGAFGLNNYAEFARGTLCGPGDPPIRRSRFLLAFMVQRGACAIALDVEGDTSPDETETLRDALTRSVLVEGKPRDSRWTDAEAKERWEKDVPPEVRRDSMLPPMRTTHYIVLTNAVGGALFGKKMEENYSRIRATFPFEERKTRRLLPVFVFKSKDQYDAFSKFVKSGMENVSKGHASKDYYATWYESPNDPVHIHEATHQIFFNRLRLYGDSWFKEGVAEYMSSSTSSRNVLANLVADGRAVPLREFMKIPTLLLHGGGSNTGPSAASEHYSQAALLIEFLRDSKQMKTKFPAFLDRLGRMRGEPTSTVDAAIKNTLGTSINELDSAFTAYCKKR
jgi:hypothetical protein